MQDITIIFVIFLQISEKWEYINVVKNPNSTISFNLNVYREFRRDLSSSSETDLIVTPNIDICW